MRGEGRFRHREIIRRTQEIVVEEQHHIAIAGSIENGVALPRQPGLRRDEFGAVAARHVIRRDMADDDAVRVHAAGVIMSASPLIDIIPLMKREADGAIRAERRGGLGGGGCPSQDPAGDVSGQGISAGLLAPATGKLRP